MLRLSLGVVAVVLAAGLAEAQQQDFSQAAISVTKVAGAVYLIEGAGGNIAASVGEDGVVLVDNGHAPLVPRIKGALKGITDKPVRFIINTHWHRDHVGGNSQFPEAIVVAQNNVRARMQAGGSALSEEVRPFPADALPGLTFLNDITLHVNGEDIRAIGFPGHTDGDCIVVFPKSNVVHMGDNFVTTGFPLVDLESGGSAHVLIEVVEILARQLGPNAKIIPGHGRVSDVQQLRAYLDMLQGTRLAVEDGIEQGKTLEQLKEASVLARWDKWSSPVVTTDQFLEALYIGLTEESAEGEVDEGGVIIRRPLSSKR